MMAVNGRLNQNGTIGKPTEKPKSSTRGEQSMFNKHWNKPRTKMSKDVKIVEDVDSELSNLPKLAVDKSANPTLKADGNKSLLTSSAVMTQNTESLAVPRGLSGTLPGSSVTSDQQKQSLGDSVSTKRAASALSLKSSRSVDSRIRHAVVQMPPGTELKEKSAIEPDESLIQIAIPNLPLALAIVCLLLNVCLPGSGTMLSGFFIFCGGQSRVPSKTEADVIVTLCVNIWVGVSQLFTVSFLLVGWFWSVAWGVKLVILSESIEADEEPNPNRRGLARPDSTGSTQKDRKRPDKTEKLLMGM